MTAIVRRIDGTAVAALIGATLCWGAVPPMIKFLARPEYIPDGFAANAIRYPVAALFWLPWLAMGWRTGQVRLLGAAALVPAAINVAGQTLWAIAPYHLDASLAAFLFQMCSVWSVIAAFVVFPDERRLARDGRFWAGAGLAVGGFVLLSLPTLRTGTGGTPLGVVVISLCGVCMAAYGVAVRYVLRDGHPLVLFSLVAAYTSVGVLVLAPLGEPAALLRLSPGIAALVIASALVGIAFAHGLFYVAVQRIGVAVSYLFLMLTPLISFAGSAAALGERFTAVQWVGGLLLLAGSAAAVHAEGRLREEASSPGGGATAPAALPDAGPPEPG